MQRTCAVVVAGLALGLMSGTAQAAFIYNFTQDATGVSVVGRGSIDLTGETFGGNTGSGNAGVIPSTSLIYTGDTGNTGVSFYTASFRSVPAFGTGTGQIASSGTGALFGFGKYNIITPYDLFVPIGYTSGTSLTSTAFFSGATLDSIGISRGAYTYTLANADFVQINVSTVPLPASAPMFGAALLGLAGLGYAAKRKKAAAAI